MIRGGIADKLGNGYEGLWALNELLNVLQGEKDAICTEPFNEDSGGFEFKVVVGDKTEWHQCKSRRSSGSWTMGALEGEGVLANFARKLTDPENQCVFVSSDPAANFKSLSGKARLVSNEAGFRSAVALNQDDAKSIAVLRRAWVMAPSVEFEWLRRCRVEVVSEDSLREILRRHCRLLFDGDPDQAIDRLLGYMERTLTHLLSTDQLRRDVSASLGLKLAIWLDPNSVAAVSEATDTYLASLRTTIAGERLSTPDGERAVAAIVKDDEQRFLIVAGQAGGGKSSTIATVIEEARAAGIQVLAFRMDRQLTCNSMPDLGEAIVGRRVNPLGLLAGRRDGRPALLIVDQVDAVSEASGRSTKARDLLFSLIRDTRFLRNLKVVLACRTYDLANDFHLKALSKEPGTTTISVEPLSWEGAVLPLLEKLELGSRSYSENERKILCLPLNLHLFAEISLSGGPWPGELSTGRLISELLHVREREAREASLTWTPSAALGAMAQFMSETQTLAAPETVLSGFSGALDHLGSMGLITRSGGSLQFAHEAFFDHIFAAHFLAQQKSVLELLRSAEQRLFRRTQVRQIFAQLRDQGVNPLYLRNLADVMAAPHVRYLVKDAVGAWLATVENPSQKELDIALSWFQLDHQLYNISRTVLGGRTWTNLLISSGTVAKWLADNEETKNFALWTLRAHATRNPSIIRPLLEAWWDKSRERTVELLGWFSSLHPETSIGELEELYEVIVSACPADLFLQRKFPHQAELGSWTHDHAELGARVLGMWLRRWMAVHPSEHPFAHHTGEYLDSYWQGEIVSKAPAMFLKEALTVFAEAIRRDQALLASGRITYSTFLSLPPNEDNEIADYPAFFRRALRSVAASDPQLATELLEALPASLARITLHLHLETIAANGEALANQLPALLANAELMKAGVGGVEWSSFASAAAATMPFLSAADGAEIERLVARHTPEIDFARRCAVRDGEGKYTTYSSEPKRYIRYLLKRSGVEERAILRTIGVGNLGGASRRRLAELDRKFAGEALPEASGARGGFVGSPIEMDVAEKMSDDNWLSAIKRYGGGEEHIFLRHRVVGGCEQLAGVLQAQTKKDPARFAALLARIPLTANKAYPNGILMGLREAEGGAEHALGAFRVGLAWPAHSFDRTLCWLAERFPKIAADEAVLEFLLKVASEGGASETAITTSKPIEKDARRRTVRELLGEDGGLTMNGINGDRGAAYEALATALWECSGTLDQVRAFLSRQIESEPLLSVRVCMIHVINSVAKYEPEAAVQFFLQIAKDDIRPTSSRSGHHFLGWAIYNYTDALMPLVNRLLQSEAEHLHAYGLMLLTGVALSRDDAEERLIGLWATDVLARRVSAYRATGNLASDRVGDRAASWLKPSFSDPEKEVRDEAALCQWAQLLDPEAGRIDVVDEFISSVSFGEHPDYLMHTLEDRIDVAPDLGMRAIRRLIALIDTWTVDGRQRRITATHGLGKTLVNLYRAFESDPAKEAEILDLFDQYLAKNLYNSHEAVAAYERH